MTDTQSPQQIAIVTGAGSGIGRAIALRLAKQGHHVVIADLNDARTSETLELLRADNGSGETVHLDVSSSGEVDAAFDALLAKHGRVDVVVNNAGVLDNMGPITEVSDAEWQRVLNVNLTGVFNVARRAVPALLESKGSIVNIASIGGLSGGRAGTAYTVSKHGVIGLTKSIAWMYADKGIRCNAVCPGGTATNIGESSPGFSEAGLQRLGPMLGTAIRTGEPREIAEVVAFLSSAAASFVNGAVVVADGGWTAG